MHLLATNRVFTFSNIATWINYAACFGFLFFFSIYLQSVKGLPAQTAGLILVIQPVIQAISSPIAGRLADRYPPAYIATIGMVICTADLAVAAAITADTPMVMIFLILGAVGLGFGIFSSPNTTAVMSSVGQEHYGIAASLLATMRGGRHAGQHDPHHRDFIHVYGGPRRDGRHDSRFHHQHAHRLCLFFLSMCRGRRIFICPVSGKRKDTAQNNEVKTLSSFFIFLPLACGCLRLFSQVQIYNNPKKS